MKTNVSIETTDQQRNLIANLIDGKATSRMASRKEITDLCQRHISGLVGESRVVTPSDKPSMPDLFRIDEADKTILHGKSPGYIYGWNKVKRGAAHA